MAKLHDARRSLERAKEAANKRLEQLDIERRELKTSVKSLNAALKALDSSKSNRPSTKPSAIDFTPLGESNRTGSLNEESNNEDV